MVNLLRATRTPRTAERHDDYHVFQGNQYWNNVMTSWDPQHEGIGSDFANLVGRAYKGNAVVYALEMTRMALVSEARPQWRRIRNGRRGDLFGNQDLSVLERPWPGGTFRQLASRMVLNADMAGTAFVARRRERPDRLMLLRPDWVVMVLGSQDEPGEAQFAMDADLLGVLYYPGGQGSGRDPVPLLNDEVAVWAPNPDPLAAYRGVSWLSAPSKEIDADQATSLHKLKFFQNGAPQPYDAGVLTPDGWVKMGSIKVGDRVFGSDGKPKAVLGVYPQGIQDVYRVTFSSGGSTECTADHLWTVANAYDRKRGVTRTLPLSRLVADGISYDSGPSKWSVPLVEPVEFDDPGDLPIDPYLLGSLLGDGSFRSNGQGSGRVTMAAHRDDVDEQQAILTPLLPDDVTIARRDRGGWSEFNFRGPGAPRTNPLTARVRELGLFDKLGYEKTIPEVYLRASVNQRVALLQGLIDTDGSVQRKQPNTVRFDSTSERLAHQVGELAGSLGAVASVRVHRLATDRGRAQWRVSISRLPDWIVPCRLARKAAIYRPELRGGRWRYIQSVEFAGRKPAQCIGVDSDDHLYVTDDFILTHNTPQMIISFGPEVKREHFQDFVRKMGADHEGVANAYRTLAVGGGATPHVVGKDLHQLDFKVTQGAGESRIAAASGVHPVVAALSEGMAGSSLNSGNFRAACRLVADRTLRPLWGGMFAALESIVPPPPDADLWYAEKEISFLQEDRKDAADIEFTKAQTIAQLVREGFEPQSVIQAVEAEDMNLLVHSGLLSVQLQTPGAAKPTIDGSTTPAAITAGGTP